MKKLSLLTILVLCLSFLFTASSCSSEESESSSPSKHPIEKFIEKLEKAESCEITITMSNIPYIGTYSTVMKLDGNIQYTPADIFGEEETYVETVGDIEYVYTKNSYGQWTKTINTEPDDDSDEELMEMLFNPDNYKKVDGKKNTYKQKDGVSFGEYENVKITIEDASCTIEMSALFEGVQMDIKFVISKLGEVELTLPNVN